jgi:hypothetical protein
MDFLTEGALAARRGRDMFTDETQEPVRMGAIKVLGLMGS